MANEKSDSGFESSTPKNKILIVTITLIISFIVFVFSVMIRNSIKPDVINLSNIIESKDGEYFVQANEALVETMLDRWLPNDIFWPTVFLDNMPNFQLGVLEVVRYNTRVLRDNLTRMRTTDKLDSHAEKAFTSFSNDPYKWLFPSAESKWNEGYNSLGLYHENLISGASTFYPRADNLAQLLDQYISLMGGVNTKLISAAKKAQKPTAAGGKSPIDVIGVEEKTSEVVVPWHEIDDNFYYAQGVAYALHLSFKAIKRDFYSVLQDKNSLSLIDTIIEVLDRCNFEPLLIFNGAPDCIFANHSLNLSGVFNDARQKINSLTVALRQG